MRPQINLDPSALYLRICVGLETKLQDMNEAHTAVEERNFLFMRYIHEVSLNHLSSLL